MKTVSNILKSAPKSARVNSNVKPQGRAAKPSSFALACAKASPALQTAARAEAAGRDALRAGMAGIVVIAAKGNMARIDAGKILAEALGLPNMARTVKGADGKHTAAASWIVSLVNAWQYAAKDLESRQPRADKPAADKGKGEGEGEGEGETGEPNTREGIIDTAAKFVALFAAFQARAGKTAADEVCQMIAARMGYAIEKPKAKLAKLASVK